MSELFEWNSSSSMAEEWEYQIEEQSGDNPDEPINWTDGERAVRVKNPNGKVTEMTVTAVGTDPAVIEIELEEGSPEAFSEEFKQTVLSAVSLSTMPVVRWAE